MAILRADCFTARMAWDDSNLPSATTLPPLNPLYLYWTRVVSLDQLRSEYPSAMPLAPIPRTP
jgi:hypothetical protein